MEDKNISEQLLPLPKNIRIFTTIAILTQNIAFGAAFTFYSPALEDLRAKYDSTVEEISKVFTIISVAYCIGGLSAGFIYDRINRQLCVIILFLGMAFALYVTPHCPSLITYFCTGAVLGFSLGAYDTAQVVWMMEIWQSKAGPFIQAQHFSYALGSNLPPLLLAPFLIKDNEVTSSTGNFTTTEIISSTALSTESRIYIPFSIGGAICTFSALIQIFLFIFYRYYTPPLEEDLANDNIDNNSITKPEKEESITEESKTSSGGINWPKMKLIVLSAMFIGADQGMEICTFQFIPTFGQYSDLKLSESESAIVLTGLTGAFTVGRFLGIFMALKIPPTIVLCANLLLLLIGNLILLIWANNNLTMFWAGCIFIGAGFSTLFPSFCAFIERHLVFTNAIGAFMMVCGSIIAAIYPLIVGKGIEAKAVTLTYTIFFSIALCTIAFAALYKLTYKSSSRLR